MANLVLVHFEGESLQPRADGGEKRLHVGELHRDEVELDEVLQCRHVPPRPQVILVHHSRLVVQHDVELPQVRARRPYQAAVVRDLSPLRRVVPVGVGEPLGNLCLQKSDSKLVKTYREGHLLG